LGLLATAIAMLPIAPDASWSLNAGAAPTWQIVGLLAASVGLPYFVLSSTGPLVQSWFARAFADRSPYRLYALSNIGSLVALLGYPFFVEPRFPLAQQTSFWGFGFVGFAALCGCAAWYSGSTGRATQRTSIVTENATADAAGRQWLAWLLIPALASMMLLATTNHVCQDVAVMPFLWVA